MRATLRQEHERLLRELSDEGVALGDATRSSIAHHFEGADERFVPSREGVERLRENTDLIAQALVEASEEVGGGYDTTLDRPAGGRGDLARSLDAEDVVDVFRRNCIWPFCDEDDLGR